MHVAGHHLGAGFGILGFLDLASTHVDDAERGVAEGVVGLQFARFQCMLDGLVVLFQPAIDDC